MPRLFPLLAVLFLCLAGCAKTTVALLPDDDGTVGRAVVTPSGGEPVSLTASGQAVAVESGGAAPADGVRLREAFGPALAAFPQAASSTIISFPHNSATPTSGSKPLIRKAADDYRARNVPQIMVIGHTDSTGERDFNNQLSMERARAVAGRLERLGVPAEAIRLQAFGSQEPLVPTRPGVSEPRNRRVEIYIW